MATDITAKWGRPVAERGFAQLPNYLLFINQFLDKDHRLSPVELLVLFQLVGTWWKKGDLPFPSMGTLAVRCGVSDRQIQRAVNQLEKVGLIQRVNRRIKGIISSNAYDLSPLVSILEEIAKAFPNEFPRNVDKATVKEISSRFLDHRHRDKNGEISRKHGNTLIGTLRNHYGAGFAPGFEDTDTLAHVLATLDQPSLTRLIKDLNAGALAGDVAKE